MKVKKEAGTRNAPDTGHRKNATVKTAQFSSYQIPPFEKSLKANSLTVLH